MLIGGGKQSKPQCGKSLRYVGGLLSSAYDFVIITANVTDFKEKSKFFRQKIAMGTYF